MAERIGIKEAVAAAMAFARELLPKESGQGFSLEETALSDDGQYWRITLGMIDQSSPFAELGATRKYKCFEVNAYDGTVEAMKIRSVND
ncbi:MAG TPA: hypothetical protein VFG50_05300 [Rhodothermales bacterium]|nr:hypothetical protein [Rhodothermales bacterium]